MAQHVFRKHREAFTEALINQHFDPTNKIIVQTYASGVSIASIQFRHSQTGQLLLVKRLHSCTEVQHVQSGALSHWGDFEAMATLSRRSQSLVPDTASQLESRVMRNVNSALPEATEMGRDPLNIRLRDPTLGSKHEPCRRTITKT